MDKINVKVDFRIMGDVFIFEEVTQKLQIHPMKTWIERGTMRKTEYIVWMYNYRSNFKYKYIIKNRKNLFLRQIHILTGLKNMI